MRETLNKEELRSVIGMYTYYHRFIQDFAKKMCPLYELLKKNKRWVCGEEERSAFEEIKEALVKNLILKIFDPQNEETRLTCDASRRGLGGVLEQRDERGWLPVLFYSEKLTGAEKNYSIGELEALSCIKGMEKFRIYLIGRKFLLRTDHKSLINILNQEKEMRFKGRILI